MKTKIGFLGTGYMGQLAHLANYAQISECQVVAIAERRSQMARAVAKKYDIPTVYDNHKQLLQDPDVEAIICAQHFHNNYWLGSEILEAGKSLLTEKPMVLRHDDGQEMVDIARTKNLLYAVGFMKRHDPGVQLARRKILETVQTGSLGALQMVDACCFMGDWLQNPGSPITIKEEPNLKPLEARYPDHIVNKYEQEYDHFLNIYSHNVNLIRYLLPDEQIECITAARNEQACTVTFESGETLISLRGVHVPAHTWQEETHFLFEQGRISVYTPPPMNRQAAAEVVLYTRDGDNFAETRLHVPVGWAFYRQAENFIAALQDKQPLLAPAEDCLRDVELMEDVFRKI